MSLSAAIPPLPGPAAHGSDRALLWVEPWADPLLESMGHDPRSAYVERFWLPVLGPSAVWLLRHLAAELEAHPGGTTIDTTDTARALGVGGRGGRNSPFLRSVERIVTFGMARQIAETHLQVRTAMAPLTQRQLQRLPTALQRDHELWIARDAEEPPAQAYRQRARALAASLLALGEELDAVERQLHRWRFHPAVAHEAVRWARHEADGAGPNDEGGPALSAVG